ncbi:MAG: hypothetical protein AAGA65_11730 [Actinomycetota bacterium]
MKKLLLSLVVAVAVSAGCSAGDEQAEDRDQQVTVTVPDADEAASDENGEDDVTTESALAFVATDDIDGGDFGFTAASGAPIPQAIEIAAEPATGRSGSVGTDGVATVAYVLWTWDGEEVERSADLADRLSATLGGPSDAPPDAVVLPTALADAIAGQPVGSRITAVFPPGTAGLPRTAHAADAHVLILDVFAFQTPEGS